MELFCPKISLKRRVQLRQKASAARVRGSPSSYKFGTGKPILTLPQQVSTNSTALHLVSEGLPVRVHGSPRTDLRASPYKSMGFPVLLNKEAREQEGTREHKSKYPTE